MRTDCAPFLKLTTVPGTPDEDNRFAEQESSNAVAAPVHTGGVTAKAILAANLFNSPPTVSGGPLNGTNESPSGLACTGLDITSDSSKKALSTVAAARARQACLEGNEG